MRTKQNLLERIALREMAEQRTLARRAGMTFEERLDALESCDLTHLEELFPGLVNFDPRHGLTAVRNALRENFNLMLRKRKARRIAKAHGCDYWPAFIVDGWSGRSMLDCDPKALVVAEKILRERTGKRYVAGHEHAGFDMQGSKGLSPAQINAMWRESGCRNGPKYRWMLKNALKHPDFACAAGRRPKHLSLAAIRKVFLGWRWCRKNKVQSYVGSIHWKTYKILGTVSWPIRFMLVRELTFQRIRANYPQFSPLLMPRMLNWDLAQRAMKDRRVLVHNLPTVRARWYYVHGTECPLFLEGVDPLLYDFDEDKKLTSQFIPSQFFPSLSSGNGGHWIALFQTAERANRFLDRSALSFRLSPILPSPVTTWNAPAWGDFCMQYPEAIDRCPMFPAIERELGRMPVDATELHRVANALLAMKIVCNLGDHDYSVSEFA